MAIDRAEFAEECVEQGVTFRVTPHFVIAVAELLSGINDDTAGTLIGPFRIAKEAWEADRSHPDIESVLTPADINMWQMQCQFATVVAFRAQEALRTQLDRYPTADELYAKWPNAPIPAGKTLQAALDSTAALVDPAFDAVLGALAPANPPTGPDSPVPSTDTVGTLSPAEWQKYCNVLGHMESGNRYNIVNRLGYSGRWQFGASALQDLGFVKAHVSNKGMASPSAWTGQDNIGSRDAWLGSKQAQDATMRKYTEAHYQSLLHAGTVKPTSSAAHVAGTLAAAHLMGIGNAIKLKDGIVTSDANGTTTRSYYRRLSMAFGGSGNFDS